MGTRLRRDRRASGRRGFSLLELMFVAAIVSVVAAIAAPRYGRSMAHYQVDSAARRIAADLGAAQFRARTYSTTLTVTFDLLNNQYAAPMPDPGRPGSSSYTVPLGAGAYGVTLVSASFGPTASPSVTFDGFGSPGAGGVVTIQSGDIQKTVTLNADTGTTTIQ